MEETTTEQELRDKLAKYEAKYGPLKEGLVDPSNFKNVSKKGKRNDWMVFIMIVVILGMAALYAHDTKVCRDSAKADRAAWLLLTNGTGYLKQDSGIPQTSVRAENFTALGNISN